MPRYSAARSDIEDDTLATALRRRLLSVIMCCAVGLIGGAVYLTLAPKKFVAASTLIVEQAIPAGGLRDETLVDTQAEIASSREVLLLADRNRELGDLPSLASAADVVSAVKRNLAVEATARRNRLTVTYASTNRDDAVKVVEHVVEAYRTYQSDEGARRAERLRGVVRDAQAKVNDEIAHADAAVAEFDAVHGTAASTDAATRRAANLADVLDRAELDTFAAKKNYDDAVTEAGPALKGMDDRQLEETLQGSGNTVVAESGEVVSQEVIALARQLVELRRTYAENHPAVIRASQRLQQMRLAQVAIMRQRWQAAQMRELSLRETFDKTQRDTLNQTARTTERTKLTEALSHARSRADALDRQLNDILLSTAAGALTIRVDSPAAVDAIDHPPLPRPAPTLATAAAIGLVLGGLLALVGEFREAGSLRHVVPLPRGAATDVGTALNLRVLATVPSAEREDSQAPGDLAHAAQLDPFGPIANSIRSMRQELEVEGKVPATIVLTAAADRQGTTTIACNLALTLARENRRVVLVDMNFAAPMAAHLMGADSTVGLVELVGGGEPMQLIRPSEIARVDVLPPGRPPMDIAAMLNSDAFTAVLTMLARAYDHVVIDASPLSRGDDARIVASLCHATVLVSKPTSASLRRAAGARDLLLMIGANLLGVTISRGDVPIENAFPKVQPPPVTKEDV